MRPITVIRGEFSLTTDKTKLDIHAIHFFLSNYSHWAKGISYYTVKKSIENSLPFGLFHLNNQIGFARIISDFATIAYLGDVYILVEYRKQGLANWMMEQVMIHPDLQNLRRWILLTADAHSLYAKHGWKPVEKPERYMEVHNPNIYKQ